MRWRRVGLVISLLLAAGALVLVVAGFWLRSHGRPVREGSLTIAGLRAEVTVRFDLWGVPHVTASSARDLALAMGWLHANDRMAQLELGRRAASGRLAELLGPPAVELDKRARTLRLRRMAERSWEVLPPESRELLEAYASGVNAWLRERDGDLPPELELFFDEPEPWTPTDSLCFFALMARDLSFPASLDEQRFQWLGAVGRENLESLLGAPLQVPEGIELLAQIGAAQRTGSSSSTELPDREGRKGRNGSNNWALGASRSADGHPLVANDPHLNLGVPNVWYQVLLRAPDYEAAGMTLPGIPMVVIGQGRDLAWSFTSTELDTNDLFVEQPNPQGTAMKRGEGWANVEIERERIAVRAGFDVELELRSSDIGPLLEAEPERGLPLRSLRWTGYEPFDPLTPFLGFARASSVRALPPLIADFVCPVQNLVAADRSGGLLFTVLGRVPERGRGDGKLPVPASDPAYAWRGLRAQAANPTSLDPPEELLATANDDVSPPGLELPFAGEFATAHRVRRIRELCLAREKWSPAEVEAAQGDVLSLHALEIVGALPTPSSPDAVAAKRELAAWDGRMELRGPSALFALFQRELFDRLFEDDFERRELKSLPLYGGAEVLLRAVRGELNAAWYDDARTEPVEDRAALVDRALEEAWRTGRERFGSDVRTWSYGELHTLTLHHPFHALPLMGAFFDCGPAPIPGSSTCIAAFTGPWRGERVEVAHGPSMRWISDTGDPDRSLAALPAGQCGHPGDPHYDDQFAAFVAGRLHGVHWSEGRIAEATVSTLVLRPAR
jgi:penicillin G amidase